MPRPSPIQIPAKIADDAINLAAAVCMAFLARTLAPVTEEEPAMRAYRLLGTLRARGVHAHYETVKTWAAQINGLSRPDAEALAERCKDAEVQEAVERLLTAPDDDMADIRPRG